MNRVLLFFFVLIALSVNRLDAQQASNHLPDIDSFLKDEFPTNKSGAVVLISSGDSVIFKKSFGLGNLESKEHIQINMIFEIASMTKQFTAAAILKLAESGKISLKDTLQQYINFLPSDKFPITIEHLLTHTSGIPYFDVNKEEYNLLFEEQLPEQFAWFINEPLEFEPGTKFRYSNSNYILLGVIIEKASGLTYGQYLNEVIFKPIGMKNSALGYQDHFPKDQKPQDYGLKEGKYTSSKPISFPTSAGGIVSTVEDLFMWNRALKNNMILSAESAKQMFTAKTLKDGRSIEYGFGFFIRELQGSKTIQHGGNHIGFTSSGLWLVEEDLFVCILSNRGFARTEEIADYIASVLIEKPIEILKKKEIPSLKLSEYTGSYKLDAKKSKQMNIIIISDRLVLIFPDQSGSEVDIQSVDGKDIFESKKVNAKLNFLRNDSGEVSGIEIIQGAKYNWIKIK